MTDPDKEVIVVVNNTPGGYHSPDSVIRIAPCCKAEVWVTPEALLHREQNPHTEYICYLCWMTQMTTPGSDWQLADNRAVPGAKEKVERVFGEKGVQSMEKFLGALNEAARLNRADKEKEEQEKK